MNLTQSQADQWRLDYNNPVVYSRECLRVEDRLGNLVPMELWASQVKYQTTVNRIRRQGRPVRLVVLKCRRSGFTMGATRDMFQECAPFPGRKGLIIADKYDPAGDEAFGYLQTYQNNFVPFERFGQSFGVPAAQISESKRRIQWGGGDVDDDEKENASQYSRIGVLTAEAGDTGRGGGRHFVLADEVAFWRDAATTLTAVLNMVPRLPGTTVVVQSTANGMGGEFYDLVQKARDPSNESGWEFLFFGWLENPLCVETVKDEAAFFAGMDREEYTLHTQHNATMEQLQWRRTTISTECRGSVEMFHQEYPTTPEEAFINSGRPALDQKGLARMKAVDPTVGELEEVREGPIARILFRETGQHGAVQIWRRPEKGKRYVIGADPSHGVDVSRAKKGANPDFSVAFVADGDSGEQVALLRGRIRPVPFGEYVAVLARWYNFGFIVPEANDPGFIDAIVRTDYPLEMMYQRQRDPTDTRPPDVNDIGYAVNETKWRDWVIGAADDAIRGMAIIIKSAVVISECQTMVVKPTGRREHMDDHHDDCVFALGYASLGLRFQPRESYAQKMDAAALKATRYGRGRKRRPDEEE